jgi:putative NADH-flavin reductase
MNIIKKIAVIGGTGKSGKYLVKQLLKQHIPFKILVRNPDTFKINDALVEVVSGDVQDYKSVLSLLKDCEAIISTLGLGVPPSARTIFSQSTKNVLKAMAEYSIERYVVTTGLNVDTAFDKKGINTASATKWMYDNFPVTTADKQLEYETLMKSNVGWTLVRLPLIEQTDEREEIKTSLEDCPGDKISAASLAHFLIEQLTDDRFIRKAPFIANA